MNKMERQDKAVSATDKIKYFEALTNESGVTGRKFSSKAYTPTPFSICKTSTSTAAEHLTECQGDGADKTLNDNQKANKTTDNVQSNEIHVAMDTHIESQSKQETLPAVDPSFIQETRCIRSTDAEYETKVLTEPVDGFIVKQNEFCAETAKPPSAENAKQLHDTLVIIDIEDSIEDGLEINETRLGECADKSKTEGSNEANSAQLEVSSNQEVLPNPGQPTEHPRNEVKPTSCTKPPIKPRNKGPKATLLDKDKVTKEESSKNKSDMETQESTINDSTKVLDINEMFEAQMELQRRFEAEIEKKEFEMEMQLRKMYDILKSVQGETEEIEKIFENFSESLKSRTNIKTESDKIDISKAEPDAGNSGYVVNDDVCKEQDLDDWLHQISQMKKHRAVNLQDLQRDIKKMKGFIERLKKKSENDAGERINIAGKDVTYKGINCFGTERKRLQSGSAVVLNRKPVPYKKFDHANITIDLNRKGNGQGDVIEKKTDVDPAFLEREIKIQEHSSLPDLSTPCRKRRKSKIPKPTWPSYQNVSRDRQQARASVQQPENNEPKEVANAKKKSSFNKTQSGEVQNSTCAGKPDASGRPKSVALKEVTKVVKSNVLKGGRREKNQPNSILKQKVPKECSLVSSTNTQAMKHLKENSVRLRTKSIKAKIDTGLKIRCEGNTKGNLKNGLQHVDGSETMLKKQSTG